MDERQEANAGKAALAVLALIMIGAVGVLGWEFVTTNDVRNTGAIVVLLGGAGLFLLFQRMFGAEAPRNAFGVELPTGPDAASRATRRRAYLVDAAIAAAGLAVLTVAAFAATGTHDLPFPFPLTGIPALIGVGLIEFAVIGVLAYLLNHAAGESLSRAVERRHARLGGE